MNVPGLLRTNPLPDLSALGRETDPAISEEIRRAADGFESLFVTQLLEPLEKSSEHLFGSGPQGRTIGGLFRDQLATAVASSRPLGIASLIEQALLRSPPRPGMPCGAPPPPTERHCVESVHRPGAAPRLRRGPL